MTNDKRQTILYKTLQRKLEDTKGVIRCHTSNKDRQYSQKIKKIKDKQYWRKRYAEGTE